MTPTVPNFVKIMMSERGKRQDGFTESPTVSVGELSNEQLESLANDWKKKLFENAERMRKNEIK